MKMHVPLHSLFTACAAMALVSQMAADPLLPFQQPSAQQLNDDITAGTGDQGTFNKALNAYHRVSRSLNNDIEILRSLNNLLANEPNYPALLSTAANTYQSDFQARRE